ncbi:IclR family transcriptional regulator [Streptomyces sp. NBC_00687]|nr:IclR family transcriptional regulator [Streptomyces sp. NBC_00687]
MTTSPSEKDSPSWASAGRGRKPPVGEAVITRAFRLLQSFDSDHRALSLADLARRAAMPRSSALRLARTLVEAGALERRKDGIFVVAVRLLEIASLAPRGHGLREVAMPFMEDLFYVTRQHVLLAVRDGDEALLVERLSAHDASQVRFRVGGGMPLTSTGVGMVLLAHAPADEQERLVRRFVAVEGESLASSEADLRRSLAEVRRGGYAIAQRDEPDRLSTIAAPVRNLEGVVAALSVVVPSAGFTPGTYVAAVRTSARAISRELGANGPTS